MALAIVVAALAIVGGAAASTPSESERLFVGRAFEGLPLTASGPMGRDAFSFIYGDCIPTPGEGGCAPPLQVQDWSICRRHPLELDRRPRRITTLRGVPMIDYGDMLEVLTGGTDVVLFGEPRRSRRAVAALRPVRGPARLGRPLAAARLPRWALRELKLVSVLRSRGATRHALRRRLGISISAIRMRERLARVLGDAALRVPPATITPGEIIRDRHALIAVEESGEKAATPDQRRRARRHRERLRACRRPYGSGVQPRGLADALKQLRG